MSEQLVYFIATSCLRFVKVGVAADPHARLAALQTGCPVPLRLIGEILGGRAEERSLHTLFRAHRAHGEWFRVEGAVADYLRERADVWDV